MKTHAFLRFALVFALPPGAYCQVEYAFTSSSGSWSPVVLSGSGTGNWIWSNGSGWSVAGVQYEYPYPAYGLVSPDLVVGATGSITFSFSHRYNFQVYDGSIAYDGGFLHYSLNQGASWIKVGLADFTQNGYNYSNISAYEPPGYSGLRSTLYTSQFSLSGLSPASPIQFRFLGAWDTFGVQPDPNWLIASVSVTGASAIPEPAAAAVCVGLIGFAVAGGRRWTRHRA